MIPPPLLALAVLGAGLAATIAYQLDLVGQAAPPPRPLAAGRPSAAMPEAPSRAADPLGDWVATNLARPLFHPDRRPTPAAPPGAAVAAEGPEVPPRLAGILVTTEGRWATFAGGPGGSVMVAEGGRIGGFTVQSIQAREVVLDGTAGSHVLHPSFDPAAARRDPALAAAGTATLGPARIAGAAGGLPAAPGGADPPADDGRPIEAAEVPSGLQIFRNMSRLLSRQGGASPAPSTPR